MPSGSAFTTKHSVSSPAYGACDPPLQGRSGRSAGPYARTCPRVCVIAYSPAWPATPAHPDQLTRCHHDSRACPHRSAHTQRLEHPGQITPARMPARSIRLPGSTGGPPQRRCRRLPSRRVDHRPGVIQNAGCSRFINACNACSCRASTHALTLSAATTHQRIPTGQQQIQRRPTFSSIPQVSNAGTTKRERTRDKNSGRALRRPTGWVCEVKPVGPISSRPDRRPNKALPSTAGRSRARLGL